MLTLPRATAVAFALLVAPLAAQEATQPQAFGGPDDQKALITGVCLNQVNLGRGGCLCLANKAMADLQSDERDYLLATVLVPHSAERMGAKLGGEGIKTVATFLNDAAVFCEKPENQPKVSDVPVSAEPKPTAPKPAEPKP